MKTKITEIEYKGAMEQIEVLLKLVDNNTPMDDPNMIELTRVSDIVEEYENEKYPIAKPTLIGVLKLRMYEMDLTQVALSKLLGVSPSRVSEYLNGKSEPTLAVARNMCTKLNIDASIVLGV